MNRKLTAGRAYVAGACYGRFFCRISIWQVLGAAILVAGWWMIMADLIDAPTSSATSSTPLVQQMVWNPSPK